MSTGKNTDNNFYKPQKATFYDLVRELSWVGLIIGLPTLCMGYLENGLNINNYHIVNANITAYLHADFYLGDKIYSCDILTDNDANSHKYNNYKYPIGSHIKLFYDFNTGYCRTEKFVNNLAIVGIVFLCLAFCSRLIFCYLHDKNNEHDESESQLNLHSYTELHSQSNTIDKNSVEYIYNSSVSIPETTQITINPSFIQPYGYNYIPKKTNNVILINKQANELYTFDEDNLQL